MNKLNRRQIRAAFGRAANQYEGSAILQKTIATQLIERFQWLRIDPRTIIDVGTGTGYVLPQLRRRYRHAQVMGIDLAQPMLQKAKTYRGFWRRSALIAADAEALPLKSKSVDCIYSNLALQWMDPLRAFKEFLRVLQVDGVLMFTTFGPDTLKEIRHSWATVDGGPHVHSFLDMHDVGDALVQAGFADPVLDVERYTLTYSDVRQALRDLKMIGAQNADEGRLAGLTGKNRFREFERAYEQLRSAGRIPVTYEVVFGHAWCVERNRQNHETRIPISSIRHQP